jgi:hypothetical protein
VGITAASDNDRNNVDPIQTFLNKLVHLYGDKAFQDEDQFLQLSEAHFSQSPGKRKVLALLIQKGVPKYLLSWKGIDEGPTKASAEQVRDSLVIKLTDANLASKEALYWAVSALLSVLIGREDLYPATQDRGQPNNASADGSKPTVSHAPIENAYARNSSSSGEGARAAATPSVVPIAQSKSPSGGRARVESNGSQQRKEGADFEPLHDRVEDTKSTFASAKNRVAEGISTFARTAKLALRAFVGLAVVGVASYAYINFSNRPPKCSDTAVKELVVKLAKAGIRDISVQQSIVPISVALNKEDPNEVPLVLAALSGRLSFADIKSSKNPKLVAIAADIERGTENLMVESIRTTSENAAIKKCVCEADVFYEKGPKLPIKYQGQLTDDGKIRVELL